MELELTISNRHSTQCVIWRRDKHSSSRRYCVFSLVISEFTWKSELLWRITVRVRTRSCDISSQFLAMSHVTEVAPTQQQPDLALNLQPPGLSSSTTHVVHPSSSIAPQVLPLTPAPSTSGPTSRKDTPVTTAEPPDVQAVMDGWQDAFIAKMKDMFSATLPQPTAGPSVLRNMVSAAAGSLWWSRDIMGPT